MTMSPMTALKSLLAASVTATLLLGAGTLRDISLALFIGTIVGTWSSIFVAAPVYAWLRQGDTIAAEAVKPRSERGAVV